MAGWTLCSKQDVVDIHPVTVAELKDSWSEMVEGLIREHQGQPNLGLSEIVTDEWHNGDGTAVLRVKKSPIISVQSLSINDVVLSASDYVVFPEYIALKGQTFPIGFLNVKTSYTSGSATVDESVRMTAVAMIVAIVNYRKRFGADASLKWGQAETKVGEESPNLNVGLTSHLVTIMKRLLKRPYVRVRYA